jgi:hypothetical protein
MSPSDDAFREYERRELRFLEFAISKFVCPMVLATGKIGRLTRHDGDKRAGYRSDPYPHTLLLTDTSCSVPFAPFSSSFPRGRRIRSVVLACPAVSHSRRLRKASGLFDVSRIHPPQQQRHAAGTPSPSPTSHHLVLPVPGSSDDTNR